MRWEPDSGKESQIFALAPEKLILSKPAKHRPIQARQAASRCSVPARSVHRYQNAQYRGGKADTAENDNDQPVFAPGHVHVSLGHVACHVGLALGDVLRYAVERRARLGGIVGKIGPVFGLVRIHFSAAGVHPLLHNSYSLRQSLDISIFHETYYRASEPGHKAYALKSS